MQVKDIATQEMLARVAAFGAKHANLFPIDELPGETFAALANEFSAISKLGATEVATPNSVRLSTKVRRVSRKTLRKSIQQIAQTASAVLADTPLLVEKFRIQDRKKDSDLIHIGKSLAEIAEPFKQQFTQHRFSIDKLNTAVQDLENAMIAQGQEKEARAKTRKALEMSTARCLTLLTRIDAILGNILGDHPQVQAEWDYTRRIVMKPASRKSQTAAKTESQVEVKPEPKPEVTPQVKSEVKPESALASESVTSQAVASAS